MHFQEERDKLNVEAPQFAVVFDLMVRPSGSNTTVGSGNQIPASGNQIANVRTFNSIVRKSNCSAWRSNYQRPEMKLPASGN